MRSSTRQRFVVALLGGGCLAVAAVAAEPVAGSGSGSGVVETPSFVAWSTGTSIHARPRGDGKEAVEIVGLSLLMPRRAAEGRLEGVRISAPAFHGGRLFATVAVPPREDAAADGMLFAVDCAGGEGRVEWAVPPPPGAVAFEGPPWVEGERVSARVRGGSAAARSRVASFDLFDGRHLPSEPAGSDGGGEP